MEIMLIIKIANIVILLGNLALIIMNVRTLKKGERIIAEAERHKAECISMLKEAEQLRNSRLTKSNTACLDYNKPI